jgi:hypothetical protein
VSHNLYSGETCSGITCTANEHCCEGHICMHDTDESKMNWGMVTFFMSTKQTQGLFGLVDSYLLSCKNLNGNF